MKKMTNPQPVSRRGFLKSALAAGAAPMILPAHLFGDTAPSNRVTSAHIGVGAQGGGLLAGTMGLRDVVQPVAACDAFQHRADGAAQHMGAGARAYQDYRELLARDDIDCVVIATPDHWHVPLSIAAIRSGKDVYLEKPMGVSMEENKRLRATAHRYGAVFQYGTQQRSFSPHCARVCELVRNGYIGELKEIHVVAPNGEAGGNPAPQPVPADLNYDLWLGPAPEAPYTADRVLGTGRWHIYDYAIGFIAGWGAHPLDVAHWGYPHIPVEYEGTGRIPEQGLYDTVLDWDVRGRYASGVLFTLKAGPDRTTFVGTEGTAWASRGGVGANPESLLHIKPGPDDVRLLQTQNHYRNFYECVRNRRTPVSDVDSATQSDFMSHLGDIAIRTGRKIRWDEEREEIIGDRAAAAMTVRTARAPWLV
jgi:glucose-fructose oxidoreductase